MGYSIKIIDKKTKEVAKSPFAIDTGSIVCIPEPGVQEFPLSYNCTSNYCEKFDDVFGCTNDAHGIWTLQGRPISQTREKLSQALEIAVYYRDRNPDEITTDHWSDTWANVALALSVLDNMAKNAPEGTVWNISC